MDQKEIDALINQGSVAEFNKKQEELLKHIAEKAPVPEEPKASISEQDQIPVPPPVVPESQKGKVMGQLSRVTEESEAGTNMVMGFLENVLSVVSRQQSFINDISSMYNENPNAIDIAEAFSFLNDNLTSIEEQIFSAMDAFQFQDIGRQKLMKVMYTLAKLNEYLNELLGGESTDRTRTFGHKIEKKSLEQDKDKAHVDAIISGFRNEPEEPAAPPPVAQESVDVDNIVAQFQNENKQEPEPPKPPEPPKQNQRSGGLMSNDDINDLIAQFQNKD